ncbi:Uncharacterized protein Rs2_22404 [Raphanus sativus]|nr:Uncharacterized protein Rs2_22404 [Raphanus sativus]
MERDGRVSVDVSRHHFVKDYDYLIVSISALEDSEEEISPTLEAARQLYSCCSHCRGKPHLQRLLVGDAKIGMVADRLKNSFHTSYIDFVSNGTNQEIFRGIYEGIQTHITEDHSNMYERFTVELWGPPNEVKSAFEEAIVELRRNCFQN